MKNQDNKSVNIYDEMDNFASEVMESNEFVEYIKVANEFARNREKTTRKHFLENFKTEEEFDIFSKNIQTFGDFYYFYLLKHTKCIEYLFKEKGFTDNFKRLLQLYEIDENKIDIDWDNYRKKENIYQESLVDILFADLEYQLRKIGYVLFGINIGYESVIYYIMSDEKYKRIEGNKAFAFFDINMMENIYNEIFEIVSDINIDGVSKGDFIEKTEDGFKTLFEDESKNIVIPFGSIDEHDESKLKIIL